jgi:hypothetical protein
VIRRVYNLEGLALMCVLIRTPIGPKARSFAIRLMKEVWTKGYAGNPQLDKQRHKDHVLGEALKVLIEDNRQLTSDIKTLTIRHDIWELRHKMLVADVSNLKRKYKELAREMGVSTTQSNKPDLHVV